MHHHTHLFWLAGIIVAALAVVLLLRLGFKRRPLSRLQQAKIESGMDLPDAKAPDVPLPQDGDR